MFLRARTKSDLEGGHGPAANDGAKKTRKTKSESALPTMIGVGAVITGDLCCDGEIQIDGRIEGNVESPNVTVGRDGSVHGQVTGSSVVVHGIINGRIDSDEVFVAATGRVTGDVVHRNLSIEEGGFLEGHCRHRDSVDFSKAVDLPDLAESA